MCGGKAPTPPPPQAPPAPIPQTDAKLEARGERQRAASKGAQSGYQATMLTEKGGDASPAPASAPVLGG